MAARRIGKAVRKKKVSKPRGKSEARPGKPKGKARKSNEARKSSQRKKTPGPIAAGKSRRTKPTRATPTDPTKVPVSSVLQRLQKVLAAAGVASRRDSEVMIEEGRVQVDGEVITQLGVQVDPDQQEIRVDGDVLRKTRRIYYLVNKPRGVVSTNRDPSGRMRVIDLVPGDTRLFTVGRLDMYSEGLMLVTNDGELANQLAHPRYGVEKTYRVTVNGHPSAESLQTIRKGVHLAEGPVRVSRVTVQSRQKNTTVMEMVLTEGRNREIRRMAARIGHKVVSLKRTGLGPLRLGDVPPGAYRILTPPEIKRLCRLVESPGHHKSQRRPGKKTTRPKTKGQETRTAGRKLTGSTRAGSVLGGDPSPRPRKKPPKKAGQGTQVKSKRRTSGTGSNKTRKKSSRPRQRPR